MTEQRKLTNSTILPAVLVLGWFFVISFVYLQNQGYGIVSISGFATAILLASIFTLAILRSRSSLVLSIRNFTVSTSFLHLYLATMLGYLIIASILLATSYRIDGSSLITTISSATLAVAGVTLVYAFFGILIFATGSRIYSLLKFNTSIPIVEVIAKIGIGITGIILFFFIVSLFKMLSLISLLGYSIVSIVFTWKEIKNVIKKIASKNILLSFNSDTERAHNPLIVLSLILIVIITAISVSGISPIGGDDLHTYYNVPKTYIEQGGITAFKYDTTNNGPLAFSYLYIPIMLMYERAINFISIPILGLTLVAIYALGRQLFSRSVAYRAALFFLLIPWTFWFSVLIKIDFLQTLFATVTIIAIITSRKNNIRWLGLAGIFFGIAVAIKYSTLLILPSILILVFFNNNTNSIYSRLKEVTIFSLVSLALFMPWLIMNTIQWSSPTFPYKLDGYPEPLLEQSSETAARSTQFYRYGTNEVQILSKDFPIWKNLWYVGTSNSTYAANKIGPLFLGLLPLFFLFRPKKKSARDLIVVGLSALTTVVIWSVVVAIQVWYMIVVFPLLVLLYAYYFEYINSKTVRTIILSTLLFIFLLQINTSRFFMVQFLPNILTQSEYYALFGSGQTLANYINTDLANNHPDFVIMPMGQQREVLIEDNYKHLFSNYILNNWLTVVLETDSASESKRALENLGITHIYRHEGDMNLLRAVWCAEGEESIACKEYTVLDDRFEEMSKLLDEVKRTKDWVIYRL